MKVSWREVSHIKSSPFPNILEKNNKNSKRTFEKHDLQTERSLDFLLFFQLPGLVG